MFVSSLAASCDLPILYIQGLYPVLGRLSVFLNFCEYNLQRPHEFMVHKKTGSPPPSGVIASPTPPKNVCHWTFASRLSSI